MSITKPNPLLADGVDGDNSTKELDFIRLAAAHRDVHRERRIRRHAPAPAAMDWKVPAATVLITVLVFGSGLVLGRVLDRSGSGGAPGPAPTASVSQGTPVAGRGPALETVRGSIHAAANAQPAHSPDPASVRTPQPSRLITSGETSQGTTQPSTVQHGSSHSGRRSVPATGTTHSASARHRSSVTHSPKLRTKAAPAHRHGNGGPAEYDQGARRVLDELARRGGG